MLQELFSLNQLKFSARVLLMIVIQSFYHPVYSIAESRLLYQQLCGMQKWTERQVRCHMDQWLCLCDRVAFMHVASLRPQPFILPIGRLLRHFRARQHVTQNGCMVLETKAEGLCSTFWSHVFVLFCKNLVLSVLQ